MRSVLVFLTLFLFLFVLEGVGQNLVTRDVVTGLSTPWEILWGPDNWIWVTERPGRISRINPETGELQPIFTIPDVYESGESGLLGMVLHPSFVDTPYVFLCYTYLRAGQLRLRCVRYLYENGTLTSPLILLDDLQGGTIHDGSRLVIAPDGTLYITTGEAGVVSLSQNLQSLNGKILRLHLDGSVPSDNPFAGSEVWSFGHRNPQGLVLHNGILYSSEHGPASDDEINIIQKGRNYGWPNVFGYCDLSSEQQFCLANNVAEPIAAWTPTIAPCGLDFYSSGLIGEWNNSLLLACLKASQLLQLKLDSTGTRIVQKTSYFVNQFGRLRDLCVSPSGKVYIATSNRDGRAVSPFPRPADDRIIEISPASLTSVERMEGSIPSRSELHQNFPNPFNPTTEIRFQISEVRGQKSEVSHVTLKVFDVLGREVATLVNGELNAGEHSVVFDAKDLPSGVYVYRLSSETFVQQKKMVVIR